MWLKILSIPYKFSKDLIAARLVPYKYSKLLIKGSRWKSFLVVLIRFIMSHEDFNNY